MTQFLEITFVWVLNLVRRPWTLLVFEFPVGTPETSLCCFLVYPSETVSYFDIVSRRIIAHNYICCCLR